MYKARIYRSWVKESGLAVFEVIEGQTDLLISASKDLSAQAREAVLNFRKEIEDYIAENPRFYTSLEPIEAPDSAPAIVRKMTAASKKAGVGPMAAVAGALAEAVGRSILSFSDEVIVENGGDIFMKTSTVRRMGIYAGERSPFTGKLMLEIRPSGDGFGVCTSSGTVSHSLSFGTADAVTVISDDAALADAAATVVGNMLKGKGDIEKAIGKAKSISGIKGVLVIIGDKLGSWGDIKLV